MVTCALWDIESRELDNGPSAPRDLLSNSRDSIVPWSTSDHALTVLENNSIHEGITKQALALNELVFAY